MPLGRPAQLQQPQPAAHHLQRRERVDGRAAVGRGQQRRERALVRVEKLHAPPARRRRPLRQAAGALRQAERRTQHRVVGDEVVQQALYRRCDTHLLAAPLPLNLSRHDALASVRSTVRLYPRRPARGNPTRRRPYVDEAGSGWPLPASRSSAGSPAGAPGQCSLGRCR